MFCRNLTLSPAWGFLNSLRAPVNPCEGEKAVNGASGLVHPCRDYSIRKRRRESMKAKFKNMVVEQLKELNADYGQYVSYAFFAFSLFAFALVAGMGV